MSYQLLTPFCVTGNTMYQSLHSPQVCVYELEDITKRSDKSINELVDWICQLAYRAQISDGSDAAIKLEVQYRLIQAIPDTDIELCKQLLKGSHDKKVSHLLEICRTYYTVESGVAAMCVGHAVHAVCHTPQAHNPKPKTSYALCPNCTHQHPPGRHNYPAQDSACKSCEKKGHWQAKCHSSSTTSLQVSHHQPWFKSQKRGENHKLPKPKQRKDPQSKTCLLLQWTAEQ